MKDDRLHIPLQREYAAALGLAVYAFASLEWHAVMCCERIEPGSIDALSDRTAGRVADTLRHLVRSMSIKEGHAELDKAARDFQAFARTRNNLLHAKPGIDAAGEQRLFRDGDQWTLAEIEGVADAFAECSARLNACLHGILGEPPVQP